jgi:cell division protein FtsL
MSPFERRQSRHYVHIVLLLSVTFMVYAGGSMAILSKRQQAARCASEIQRLEQEIVTVERRVRYLDTKIAEIHQPAYLRSRAEALGLGLRPPAEQQVVYLRAVPPPDTPGSRAGDEQPAGRDPYRRTFDLAVMEPLRPNN